MLAPGKTWGGDEQGPGQARILGKILEHAPGVLADSLGQAGGADADDLGPVGAGEVSQGLAKIAAAAENRRFLTEGRRGHIHRLTEVGDQVAPDVGGAALGTVHQGHAAANAAKGQDSPEGRAHAAGIGGRRPRRRGAAHGTPGAVMAARRGTNFQTGLRTVWWTSRAKEAMPAKPASPIFRSWL